jgi:hypothetical protein
MSNHRNCFWNCGGTDCTAPVHPWESEPDKDRAIELIMDQLFF